MLLLPRPGRLSLERIVLINVEIREDKHAATECPRRKIFCTRNFQVSRTDKRTRNKCQDTLGVAVVELPRPC